MNSSDRNNKSGLWLALYFPALPLEVFARGFDDDTKPVIIVEAHRVCRLNAAAAALGIARGNSTGTAYSLADHLASFERDSNKEYRHLEQLAGWAYRFTPNVAIKAPDTLLLDIAGCLKLFGGLAALKQQVIEGLAGLGYEPAVGVNTTPLAAMVSARSRLPDNTGSAAGALQHVPVSALTVDEKTIGLLQQMGIGQVGELLALPKSGLNRRFGVYFTDYLERLLGNKPDPQTFIDPAPRFFNEITFLADVTDTQALLFPIKRLLGELCDFLVARQLDTRQLNWTLSHRAHPPCPFTVHLANPENDRHVFLALTQLKLDQLAAVKEVDSISLAINRFEKSNAISGDLFRGTRFQGKDGRHQATADTANANHLFNMLHARLGPGTCFGLGTANDHSPEKAWQLVRIGQKHKAVPTARSDANPRPVFLLDRPRQLNVVNQTPCLGSQLKLLQGPERIDFGWWDEKDLARPTTRDYYIARHPDGALYWVFNCPGAENRWYLHGIFS